MFHNKKGRGGGGGQILAYAISVTFINYQGEKGGGAKFR